VLITLSATSSLCFGAKKIASWLFMMTHNAIYLSNLIGTTTWHYAPVLPVKVSRPYFTTRPQGAREKFGVWGRDYCLIPSREARELRFHTCDDARIRVVVRIWEWDRRSKARLHENSNAFRTTHGRRQWLSLWVRE